MVLTDPLSWGIEIGMRREKGWISALLLCIRLFKYTSFCYFFPIVNVLQFTYSIHNKYIICNCTKARFRNWWCHVYEKKHLRATSFQQLQEKNWIQIFSMTCEKEIQHWTMSTSVRTRVCGRDNGAKEQTICEEEVSTQLSHLLH